MASPKAIPTAGAGLTVNLPEVRRVPAGVTLPITLTTPKPDDLGARSPSVAGHADLRAPAGVNTDVLAAPAAESPSLIWAGNDGSATLWRMAGASWSLEGKTILVIPSPWKLAASGDMNGDGEPDLIWEATDGTKAVTYLRGSSYAGSFAMMVVVPPVWHVAAAADLNGDSKGDLILENTSTGDHLGLIMNGAVFSGTFVGLPLTALTTKLVAVADITADGKPDLIWEDLSTGARSFTPMNGTIPGTTRSLGNLAAAWQIGGAGDYNADGQADLVVQNMSDGQRRIMFVQNEALTGQYSQIHTVPPTNRVVAAAPISWLAKSTYPITDVASLRAAITAAGPNTRVTIPPGVYDLGNTSLKIDSKTNVEIFGSGRGQTILKGGPSTEYVVELEGSNVNLKIAHLSILGSTSPTMVVNGLGSGHMRYDLKGARYFDLDIQNVGIGISITASGNGVCQDVEITDNYLNNIQDFLTPTGTTSGSGYGIHNDACTQVRIAGNTLRNVDRHSIYQGKAYQADRPGTGIILIENNLIIDHAKTPSITQFRLVAIAVARSSNVVVAHNVVVNSYEDAFSIENAPEEGVNYAVNNIRIIGNTVLGSRGDDVFLTASGYFTHWGNKYYHSDAQGAPSVPSIYKDGLGLTVGGYLVEPTGYAGTQGMATAGSTASLAIMQGSIASQTSATYWADPAQWPRVQSTYAWSAFEAMTASLDRLFVVNNHRLYEVNAATFATRNSPTVFGAPAIPVFANDRLVLVSGNQFFTFDDALATTTRATPGSGVVHGMAGFKGKLYLYVGTCYYEVDPVTFASTTIGC